jgi:hypothetical protein
MGVITLADQQVAIEASTLLVKWHKSIRVTPSQVVRWRSIDLFEVPEGPRRGRGNLRKYPANAPEVAARFALALADVRDADEAILMSFVDEVGVGPVGLASAYGHVFTWAERKLEKVRMSSKRTKFFSHLGIDGGVSQITGDVLLDSFAGHGLTHPELSRHILDDLFGPGSADAFDEGDEGVSRLTQLIGKLSFSTLRRTAQRASLNDLAWAIGVARTCLDYAAALSQMFDATSVEDANPTLLLLANVGRAMRKIGVSRKLGIAMVAPAILLMASGDYGRDQLNIGVAQCASEIPRIRATIALAEALPERWRPCFGPGGMAQFATLPIEDQAELKEQVLKWVAEFPEESRTLVSG